MLFPCASSTANNDVKKIKLAYYNSRIDIRVFFQQTVYYGQSLIILIGDRE
jgi:hypothetical protein